MCERFDLLPNSLGRNDHCAYQLIIVTFDFFLFQFVLFSDNMLSVCVCDVFSGHTFKQL